MGDVSIAAKPRLDTSPVRLDLSGEEDDKVSEEPGLFGVGGSRMKKTMSMKKKRRCRKRLYAQLYK